MTTEGSRESRSSPSTEESGRGRWSLIYPVELVLDSGIACQDHGRPTGLLHSCGEAFCEECLASAHRCSGCGEELSEDRKRFQFCCE